MGLTANIRCPDCNAKTEIHQDDTDHLADSVVKASSEEIIMEVRCKEKDCHAVWRAVYAFVGNQE